MRAVQIRACVVAVTAAMIAVPSAEASGPPGLSGLWQYVEMVPSTRGPKVEREVPVHTSITPAEQRAIGTTTTERGRILHDVAASPAYGAPAAARPPGHHIQGPANHASTTVRAHSSVGADGAFRTLIVLLPLSLLGAVGVRLGGRRRPGRR